MSQYSRFSGFGLLCFLRDIFYEAQHRHMSTWLARHNRHLA